MKQLMKTSQNQLGSDLKQFNVCYENDKQVFSCYQLFVTNLFIKIVN